MSERLPGYELLCNGGFGCSSLWLGKDHLLYIDGSGVLFPVRERYRRFAYADIDSLVLAKNSVRGVVSLLCGVALLVGMGCLLSVLQADTSNALTRAAIVIAVLTVLLAAVLLVRNWIRGATCTGELTTRVGRVRPRPLRRLHTAEPALARLEEKVRRAREPGASQPNRRQTGTAARTLASPPTPQLPAAALPAFAINAVLAIWLATTIWLGRSSVGSAVVTSLLAFGAALALLLAVAAMSRRPAPLEAGLLLWALFVPLLAITGVALICYAVLAVWQPDLAAGSLGLAQMFGEVRDLLPSSVSVLLLLLCMASAVLAGAGLLNSLGRRGSES